MTDNSPVEIAVVVDILDHLLAAAESAEPLSDDDAEALYALAYQALLADKFEEADSLLEILQCYRPADPRFLAAYAQSRRGLGHPEQAVGLRSLALVADGGNPEHLLGMAEDFIAANDRDTARSVLQVCTEHAGAPERARLRERAQALAGLLGHAS